MEGIDEIQKLLAKDLSYDDKIELTKIDLSSTIYPKSSESRGAFKDRLNMTPSPLKHNIIPLPDKIEASKQTEIVSKTNQRNEFIGAALAEKSHLPHLYTVIDMKDKNTANKSQSDIIAGGLNYNCFVLSKIFDLKRNPMISKELQHAMILLFDNLEKLTTNCDQYTARHTLRKEKGRLNQTKLQITKKNDKIIIPKNMIK